MIHVQQHHWFDTRGIVHVIALTRSIDGPRFFPAATARLLYADDDFQNMVVYECEHELASGHCADDGVFVVWYRRSRDAPDDELLQKMRLVLLDACVQPGDLQLVWNTEENGTRMRRCDVIM